MKGKSVKQPMYHVPTGKRCMGTHTTHNTISQNDTTSNACHISCVAIFQAQGTIEKKEPREEQPLEDTHSLSDIKKTDTYHQNYLAQKQGATADCTFQLKADKQRLQN